MKYGLKSIRGALLTGAASGVLILLAPSALAQSADAAAQADAQAAAQDTESSDEIIITGFRAFFDQSGSYPHELK